MATRRKYIYFIHMTMLVLLISSGCKTKRNKFSGEWINLQNSSKSDFVLFHFHNEEISVINGNNDLKKWYFDVSGSQVTIKKSEDIYERFQYELLTGDTLILNREGENDYYLVKIGNIAVSGSNNGRAYYDSIKTSLTGNTWQSRISVIDDSGNESERRSLLEFRENDKALFYTYQNDEYLFSNVLEWNVLYQGSTCLLILRGIMNNYIFITSISSNKIKGFTFSTGKWDFNRIGGIDSVELKKHLDLIEEESIDLAGNWKVLKSESFQIPDELYIEKGAKGLEIDFLYKNSKRDSNHKLALNFFQNLLILDDLDNGRSDLLEVLEYKDNQITLKWRNGRETVVFKKYHPDYFLD